MGHRSAELVPIDPRRIDRDTWFWLWVAADSDIYRPTAYEVVERALAGLCQIWRIEGDSAEGILVTEIGETRKGRDRELFVWLMAGRGLRFAVLSILAELERIAKQYDCRYIRSHSLPQIGRRLEREGWRCRYWVMERDLGEQA